MSIVAGEATNAQMRHRESLVYLGDLRINKHAREELRHVP